MLFGTGRPVLVATPDRAPAEKVKHIALAWDGSTPAARALSFALALFPDIKHVDVVSVGGEKDLSEAVAGAEIAAHVERHGAVAKVFDLMAEKGGVAPVIDGFAGEAKADLIVMGGFGHSRFREFVLGGVTRALSKSAKTPLLLAH
jgi:nucleotide-binding universal stress UspA family protein